MPKHWKSERAIPILEGQIREAESLRALEWTDPLREEWGQTAEAAITNSLEDPSPSLEAFERTKAFVTSSRDNAASLRDKMNAQLDGQLAVLRSICKQLRWTLDDSQQIFMPAGSQHDAYVEIRKIISSATSEIIVVDGYVDQTLWPLLKNFPNNVSIRILTMQPKADFAVEAKTFKRQHGNAVEIRSVSSYHDRFVVIDTSTVWHLGASIKDAGSKAFAMTALEIPNLKKFVIDDIEATWAGAASIPIPL